MDQLNYKMGWLLVMFDLPTTTQQERRSYVTFREFLLSEGYLMVQFSVYVRSCVSFARQETHMSRLQLECPPKGRIVGIFLTNIQWKKSYFYYGPDKPKEPPAEMPEQLLLW